MLVVMKYIFFNVIYFNLKQSLSGGLFSEVPKIMTNFNHK